MENYKVNTRQTCNSLVVPENSVVHCNEPEVFKFRSDAPLPKRSIRQKPPLKHNLADDEQERKYDCEGKPRNYVCSEEKQQMQYDFDNFVVPLVARLNGDKHKCITSKPPLATQNRFSPLVGLSSGSGPIRNNLAPNDFPVRRICLDNRNTVKRNKEFKQNKMKKHSDKNFEKIIRVARVEAREIQPRREPSPHVSVIAELPKIEVEPVVPSELVEVEQETIVEGEVVKTDSVGSGIISNYDQRKFQVKFTKYKFAYLDFVGIWNSDRVHANEQRYMQHYGMHLHHQDIEVEIPSTLVQELGSYWAHKKRDFKFDEFMVSVIKCKVYCSGMKITAEQERVAIYYAPVIAYHKYFNEQENITRVLMGKYTSFLHPSLRRLWDYLKYLFTGSNNKVNIASLNLANIYQVSQLFNFVTVPALEEIVKRTSLGTGFIWFEFLLYMKGASNCGLNLYKAVLIRLAAVLVHYITKSMTYKFGVLTHLIYNAIAANYEAALINWASMNIFTGFVQYFSSWFNTKIVTRQLVNANVPLPKSFKPTAKVVRDERELPGKLRFKPDDHCSGIQAVLAYDTADYAPTAFASNAHNEKQALNARVLCETQECKQGAIEDCVQWAKLNHDALFPKMENIQSFTFKEYIDSSNASPSVKTILNKTYIKLINEGVDEGSILSRMQRYSWTSRSSFVKVENNLYNSPAGIKNKAPRLIQGANPEFICLVGPWIAAFQKLLKRRWGVNNFMCFTSGLDAKQVASFITSQPDWMKLEDDIGKFDTSVRRAWCEYEVWLVKRCGAPRAVTSLMKSNIQTHGSTHHGWKYKVDGTRKSGDPYTSCMNSVLNGIMHLYLYCQFTNKSVEQAKSSIKMVLQGDDNGLVHAEQIEYPWVDGMATLGFESEAVYRSTFDTMEFCSSRLYNTAQGWCFGPKPGRVLAKLGYIINPPLGVSHKSLVRGIALGLERSVNFIPPLKCVVGKLLEQTEGCEAYFEKGYQYKMKVKSFYDSTPEINYHLEQQYGWTCDMQNILQNMSMKLLSTLDHPFFEVLFDRDTSAPQVIFCGISAA